MISEVSGVVLSLRLDAAVLAVGGVGLLLSATPNTLASLRVGTPARLATSLVVREDSLTLFGFADDDARDTFELVQTVSGVGPRLALAIMAVHDPQTLRAAVASEDLTALMRVPGIGRKGAQRMVLELGDRLGPPASATAVSAMPSAAVDVGVRAQVVSALVGLGWAAKQADDAVIAVAPDGDAVVEAAALLRSALRHLGRP